MAVIHFAVLRLCNGNYGSLGPVSVSVHLRGSTGAVLNCIGAWLKTSLSIESVRLHQLLSAFSSASECYSSLDRNSMHESFDL